MKREAFAIFAIALSVRLLLSIFRVTHALWGPPYLELEIFNDFNGIYVTQLQHLAQGYLPYRDFAYNYPPLFLYSLYPLYALGGAALAWLPVVLSDAGSAVMIYLILQHYADRKIATAAGLIYALSPFMLVYEGYLWFSSEPMVFFVLLSLYLLQIRKVSSAAVCFGIAVLFKQDALFLLPAYIAALWYTHPRQVAKGLGIPSVIALVGCSPFLILAPSQFLTYISFSTLAVVGVPYVPPLVFPASGSGLITAVSIAPGTCSTFAASVLTSICATVIPQTFFSSSLGTFYLILNTIGEWVLLPFALLAGVALYAVRRKRGFVFLMGAYSSTVVFVLFATTIYHPAFYRYYSLAAYSLLLAAGWRRSLLIVVVVATAISLLTPSGIFQEMIPLFAVLSMTMILDADKESSSFENRELQ